MKNRIKFKIDSELWEFLNAAAWVRIWQMFPPDTQVRGPIELQFNDDTYSLHMISTEFDEIDVGTTAPEFDLEASRPIGCPIEDAQFTLHPERYGDPEPRWVKASRAVARSPVSPEQVHQMLGDRAGIALPKGYTVDYAKLEAALHASQNRSASQSQACICDFAYTGLRHHRSDCPCRR